MKQDCIATLSKREPVPVVSQKFDNVFLFIAELLTIDKLFIRVFKKYESLIVYA